MNLDTSHDFDTVYVDGAGLGHTRGISRYVGRGITANTDVERHNIALIEPRIRCDGDQEGKNAEASVTMNVRR